MVSFFYYFHPYLEKMNPFWPTYFSRGLVQPPTRLPPNLLTQLPCFFFPPIKTTGDSLPGFPSPDTFEYLALLGSWVGGKVRGGYCLCLLKLDDKRRWSFFVQLDIYTSYSTCWTFFFVYVLLFADIHLQKLLSQLRIVCGWNKFPKRKRKSESWRFFHCSYFWWFRNPARKPVEVGSLSYYLQGFTHPRWWISSNSLWEEYISIFNKRIYYWANSGDHSLPVGHRKRWWL